MNLYASELVLFIFLLFIELLLQPQSLLLSLLVSLKFLSLLLFGLLQTCQLPILMADFIGLR